MNSSIRENFSPSLYTPAWYGYNVLSGITPKREERISSRQESFGKHAEEYI